MLFFISIRNFLFENQQKMTDPYMSMFESCTPIGLLGQASVSHRSIDWPYRSALCAFRHR